MSIRNLSITIAIVFVVLTVFASIYMTRCNEQYQNTFYKIGDQSYVKTDMGGMLAKDVDTNDAFTSNDTYGYLVSWLPAMLPNTSGQINDEELLSK